MGKKLPPEQMELYRFIDEVLYREWDPIGVSDLDEARDEYQSYLPLVFVKAVRGESAEEIASYLREIELGHMGLSSPTEYALTVAEKIVAKKAALNIE